MAIASRRYQPAKNYDWAKEWASLFESILPTHVCENAMATCRFRILGKNTNGNEYGKGFRTFMQTFGNVPVGLTNDVQIRRHWIELDAHASANLILECFGLTTDDVYDFYGEPVEGEGFDYDLIDLVTSLAPDFAIPETATAVA